MKIENILYIYILISDLVFENILSKLFIKNIFKFCLNKHLTELVIFS